MMIFVFGTAAKESRSRLETIQWLVRFLLLFLLTWQLGVAAGEPAAQDAPSPSVSPRIEKIDLLNGFRVLKVDKTAQAKTVVNLLIKSGSVADPKGKEGLAFLTAQSVSRANEKTPLERWKDELEFLDITWLVRVDGDSTIFQAEVAPENLDSLLTLLTRVVVRPVFSKAGLERLKEESNEPSSSGIDPTQLGLRRFLEFVFAGTACGHSIKGSANSIQALTVADLEEFHRVHYLPNNAALIVVGGPPMDQLGGLVRERFGNWIKRATLQMEPVTNSALSFNSIRVVSHQILDEAVLVMGHSGPSRDSPDHLALTAASLLLGGAGPESRLEGAFKSQGIPYRSLTAESQFGKSCGRFQVLARIPVSFLQQAIQLVLKEIEGLKADPVTEPELNLVKSRLLDRHKEDLSSDAGLANGIAEVELYELSRDFLSVFRSRVERLSPERVQESAKNHLSSTRIAVIIVGDREKTASGLTGFRSIEILEEPDAMPPANSK